MISVVLLAISLTIVVVLVHYEALILFSRLIEVIRSLRRVAILVLIFGLLSAHVTEIWIFASGYYVAAFLSPEATLQGLVNPNFLDFVYFSSMTYSTVGYGEIVPLGSVRFLAAMEALTGLLMIGWSASFTYLEMQQFWLKRQ